MNTIELKEKKLDVGLFQFIFPFSLKDGSEPDVFSWLRNHDFRSFRLNQLEDETRYYGSFHVSHRDIEAYYLPFTNKLLFPHSDNEKGFHRFSKALNKPFYLETEQVNIPFDIHSLDVIICSYQLGFLTVRTQIAESAQRTLSEAIEFASRFRVLEPRTTRDRKTKIHDGDHTYNQIENFLFDQLLPGITVYFDWENSKGSYFETFPFFEDERMYVQALISLNEEEEITYPDIYRTVGLTGINQAGKPFVGANNLEYIKTYLKKHSYERWAPNTYYVMEEHCFVCITNETQEMLPILASQMYGEFYYGLLLNLFHKIVLLTIANDYSKINIDRDTKEINKLIFTINSFTANFFFLELATQSQGRDLFIYLRKVFKIDLLYNDTRQTLSSLFKYQENAATKKDSTLLLILTLYTVIGGIFGMNLVIDDLKGKIHWQKMLSYSPFEYIALFLAISGLFISVFLGIQNLIQWRKEKKEKKRWMSETIISGKKQP
ncbi:hypothetical protein ACQYAD_12900 [Neobacillus sp. SM06]|uniref:hypothetical protein n=1 Tax=Neobacillus sp. SM06 TaxID=3422492 RepID=UPI003D288C79